MMTQQVREKEEKMKWLWKREWKYDRRKLFTQLGAGVFWPLVCLILYKINYKISPAGLHSGSRWLRQMPKEIPALFGLVADWQEYQTLYYISLPVLVLNVWIVWKNGVRMKEVIQRDERCGSIYLMCNQMYTRRKLVVSKYLWLVCSTLVTYVVWSLLFLLLLLAGASDQAQRSTAVELSVSLLVTGVCVQVLVLSIIFLYTVYRKKRNGYVSDGVNLLIFGTLILGNLYKIRDLISLLIQKEQWSGSWVEGYYKATDWLDSLRWLSPLSWMNPYVLLQEKIPTTAVICCVVFGGLCALAGMIGYERREL